MSEGLTRETYIITRSMAEKLLSTLFDNEVDSEGRDNFDIKEVYRDLCEEIDAQSDVEIQGGS